MEALKAPGLSDWLLRHSVAYDWLGSRYRQTGRSPERPKPALPVSPQAELSLQRLKLSRELRRGSSTGQDSRKLLYWGPPTLGESVECGVLSSGGVSERSLRADALLRDCKSGATAQRPASPDVSNRTRLVLSVCLPA